MFYDDLPIWGFIGKVEKLMKSGEKPDLRYYLFTHIHFEILYNANRVIELSVSTDPSKTVDITDGENIIVDYTYSVKWHDTSIPYEKRMDKYSRYSFLPQHLEVSSGCHHLRFSSAYLCHAFHIIWGMPTYMLVLHVPPIPFALPEAEVLSEHA